MGRQRRFFPEREIRDRPCPRAHYLFSLFADKFSLFLLWHSLTASLEILPAYCNFASSSRNNVETIAAINSGKNWVEIGILAIEFYLLEHWSMSGNTERSSLSGIVVEVGWASINVRGIMCTCPSNLDEVPRIG